MRNRYPGICYKCGFEVKVNKGHFERSQGKWRLQHAACCLMDKEKQGRTLTLQNKKEIEEYKNQVKQWKQ